MHRLIKNRLFPALALAAALISPSAHAQAASGNDPIKLGLIDIYSGGFAFIADSIRTGFQIAVDEANAAGGLKGRPFQLVSADMGGQVEKAVTEGRRMILEDKIKFVTVGIHSGAAIAVGNLGKEHKVLVTGGFATTKRLTGESGHPYISRANLSTVEIGSVIAEYIKARPDIKRISTIAPDYEYGQQFIEDFMRALKLARPDVVVMSSVKDLLPANTAGTVWYPFYALNSAKSKSFAAEVEKRMKTYPTGPTTVGYSAGKMIVESIRKAGTATDVEKVIQAMSTISFEGPTGKTKVRGCDNMAMFDFYVGTVKRDAAFPDGIGVTDIKTYRTEDYARPCQELLRSRGS